MAAFLLTAYLVRLHHRDYDPIQRAVTIRLAERAAIEPPDRLASAVGALVSSVGDPGASPPVRR